jgi:hypothetical protein
LINPKPDIIRLPPALAADVLTGNGFEVVTMIDLDDGDPLVAIKELGGAQDGVIGRVTPEPGDKVVMLARDGKVVDYVVTEKGSGRLPFETQAESAAKIDEAISRIDFSTIITAGSLPGADTATGRAAPELPLGELNLFEDRLNGLIEVKEAAEQDVDRLTAERTKLSDELKDLEGSFAKLDTRRNAAASDLTKSKAELAALERAKAASLEGIRATKAELETVKKAHTEFVVTMRREQPVEAVLINNPEAVAKLKARGIVSVGDLEKMDTRTLTSTLRNTGLTGTSIKTLASRFIRR